MTGAELHAALGELLTQQPELAIGAVRLEPGTTYGEDVQRVRSGGDRILLEVPSTYLEHPDMDW